MVGDDVDAVRSVSSAAKALADNALPRLLAAGDVLTGDGLKPRNGRVDVNAIREVSPDLEAGARELGALSARMDLIRESGLVGPLRTRVESLKSRLHKAVKASALAARATRLLPDVLGARGPRSYLMVFQNNANARQLGGMAGAVAVLRADDGKIEMAQQGNAIDLGMFPDAFIKQSQDEAAVYTSSVVRESTDVANIPDFPRNGEVYRQLWERSTGQRVDGVLSMDTVALARMLRSTGPLTVQGRTITPGNAVDELLFTTYLRLRPVAQDKFYAEVARALFARVVGGDVDPRALAGALRESVDERRLMFWSADNNEQRQLSGTALANEFPKQRGDRPQVAAYINDMGNDKLTYFLRHKVDLSSDRCNNGSQRLTLTLTLDSQVPQDHPFPSSVLGLGEDGVPLGTLLVGFHIYAPPGGRIDSMSIDGGDLPLSPMTHLGRPVTGYSVAIPPQGSTNVKVQLYTAPGQGGDAVLTTTPGMEGRSLGSIGPSACKPG